MKSLSRIFSLRLFYRYLQRCTAGGVAAVYILNLFTFVSLWMPTIVSATDEDTWKSNYASVMKVGASCFDSFSPSYQSSALSMTSETFGLFGTPSSKPKAFEIAEHFPLADTTSLYRRTQAILASELAYEQTRFAETFGRKLIPASSSPIATHAYQAAQTLRSWETSQKISYPTVISPEQVASEMAYVNQNLSKINQVCSSRHTTYTKLMNAYQNKSLQNSLVNPEITQLLHPERFSTAEILAMEKQHKEDQQNQVQQLQSFMKNYKPSTTPAKGTIVGSVAPTPHLQVPADIQTQIRTRLQQERDQGAIESTFYSFLNETSSLSFLLTHKTSLSTSIGTLDPVACVEKGQQLKLIPNDHLIAVSILEQEQTFQKTMKEVVRDVPPFQATEQLQQLIQANPVPVRLALEVQPQVKDARHVCQMIQQIDQTTRNQEMASDIAMTVPGFEWFGAASNLMRVTGLIARSYMLLNSAAARQSAQNLIQKINQGMLAREIPSTQGQQTIDKIKEQRPTLLALAVQTALTVGGLSNVSRMIRYESQLQNLGRFEGGGTQVIENPSTQLTSQEILDPSKNITLWNKDGTGTLQQSNEGTVPSGNAGTGTQPQGPKGAGGGGLGTLERVAPKTQLGSKLEVTSEGKLAAPTKNLTLQNRANALPPNSQVSNLPFLTNALTWITNIVGKKYEVEAPKMISNAGDDEKKTDAETLHGNSNHQGNTVTNSSSVDFAKDPFFNKPQNEYVVCAQNMNPATEAGRNIICKALSHIELRAKAIDLIIKNKIVCNAPLALPNLESVLNKSVYALGLGGSGIDDPKKGSIGAVFAFFDEFNIHSVKDLITTNVLIDESTKVFEFSKIDSNGQRLTKQFTFESYNIFQTLLHFLDPRLSLGVYFTNGKLFPIPQGNILSKTYQEMLNVFRKQPTQTPLVGYGHLETPVLNQPRVVPIVNRELLSHQFLTHASIPQNSTIPFYLRNPFVKNQDSSNTVREPGIVIPIQEPPSETPIIFSQHSEETSEQKMEKARESLRNKILNLDYLSEILLIAGQQSEEGVLARAMLAKTYPVSKLPDLIEKISSEGDADLANTLYQIGYIIRDSDQKFDKKLIKNLYEKLNDLAFYFNMGGAEPDYEAISALQFIFESLTQRVQENKGSQFLSRTNPGRNQTNVNKITPVPPNVIHKINDDFPLIFNKHFQFTSPKRQIDPAQTIGGIPYYLANPNFQNQKDAETHEEKMERARQSIRNNVLDMEVFFEIVEVITQGIPESERAAELIEQQFPMEKIFSVLAGLWKRDNSEHANILFMLGLAIRNTHQYIDPDSIGELREYVGSWEHYAYKPNGEVDHEFSQAIDYFLESLSYASQRSEEMYDFPLSSISENFHQQLPDLSQFDFIGDIGFSRTHDRGLIPYYIYNQSTPTHVSDENAYVPFYIRNPTATSQEHDEESFEERMQKAKESIRTNVINLNYLMEIVQIALGVDQVGINAKNYLLKNLLNYIDISEGHDLDEHLQVLYDLAEFVLNADFTESEVSDLQKTMLEVSHRYDGKPYGPVQKAINYILQCLIDFHPIDEKNWRSRNSYTTKEFWKYIETLSQKQPSQVGSFNLPYFNNTLPSRPDSEPHVPFYLQPFQPNNLPSTQADFSNMVGPGEPEEESIRSRDEYWLLRYLKDSQTHRNDSDVVDINRLDMLFQDNLINRFRICRLANNHNNELVSKQAKKMIGAFNAVNPMNQIKCDNVDVYEILSKKLSDLKVFGPNQSIINDICAKFGISTLDELLRLHAEKTGDANDANVMISSYGIYSGEDAEKQQTKPTMLIWSKVFDDIQNTLSTLHPDLIWPLLKFDSNHSLTFVGYNGRLNTKPAPPNDIDVNNQASNPNDVTNEFLYQPSFMLRGFTSEKPPELKPLATLSNESAEDISQANIEQLLMAGNTTDPRFKHTNIRKVMCDIAANGSSEYLKMRASVFLQERGWNCSDFNGKDFKFTKVSKNFFQLHANLIDAAHSNEYNKKVLAVHSILLDRDLTKTEKEYFIQEISILFNVLDFDDQKFSLQELTNLFESEALKDPRLLDIRAKIAICEYLRSGQWSDVVYGRAQTWISTRGGCDGAGRDLNLNEAVKELVHDWQLALEESDAIEQHRVLDRIKSSNLDPYQTIFVLRALLAASAKYMVLATHKVPAVFSALDPKQQLLRLYTETMHVQVRNGANFMQPTNMSRTPTIDPTFLNGIRQWLSSVMSQIHTIFNSPRSTNAVHRDSFEPDDKTWISDMDQRLTDAEFLTRLFTNNPQNIARICRIASSSTSLLQKRAIELLAELETAGHKIDCGYSTSSLREKLIWSVNALDFSEINKFDSIKFQKVRDFFTANRIGTIEDLVAWKKNPRQHETLVGPMKQIVMIDFDLINAIGIALHRVDPKLSLGVGDLPRDLPDTSSGTDFWAPGSKTATTSGPYFYSFKPTQEIQDLSGSTPTASLSANQTDMVQPVSLTPLEEYYVRQGVVPSLRDRIIQALSLEMYDDISLEPGAKKILCDLLNDGVVEGQRVRIEKVLKDHGWECNDESTAILSELRDVVYLANDFEKINRLQTIEKKFVDYISRRNVSYIDTILFIQKFILELVEVLQFPSHKDLDGADVDRLSDAVVSTLNRLDKYIKGQGFDLALYYFREHRLWYAYSGLLIGIDISIRDYSALEVDKIRTELNKLPQTSGDPQVQKIRNKVLKDIERAEASAGINELSTFRQYYQDHPTPHSNFMDEMIKPNGANNVGTQPLDRPQDFPQASALSGSASAFPYHDMDVRNPLADLVTPWEVTDKPSDSTFEQPPYDSLANPIANSSHKKNDLDPDRMKTARELVLRNEFRLEYILEIFAISKGWMGIPEQKAARDILDSHMKFEHFSTLINDVKNSSEELKLKVLTAIITNIPEVHMWVDIGSKRQLQNLIVKTFLSGTEKSFYVILQARALVKTLDDSIFYQNQFKTFKTTHLIIYEADDRPYKSFGQRPDGSNDPTILNNNPYFVGDIVQPFNSNVSNRKPNFEPPYYSLANPMYASAQPDSVPGFDRLEQILNQGEISNPELPMLLNRNDLCRIRFTTINVIALSLVNKILRQNKWSCGDSPWQKLADIIRDKNQMTKKAYLEKLRKFVSEELPTMPIEQANGISVVAKFKATNQTTLILERVLDEVFPYLGDENQNVRELAIKVMDDANSYFPNATIVKNLLSYLERSETNIDTIDGVLQLIYSHKNIISKSNGNKMRTFLQDLNKLIRNEQLRATVVRGIDFFAPRQHQLQLSIDLLKNLNNEVSQNDNKLDLENILNQEDAYKLDLSRQYDLSDICDVLYTSSWERVRWNASAYLQRSGLQCSDAWQMLDKLVEAEASTDDSTQLELLNEFNDELTVFLLNRHDKHLGISSDEDRFLSISLIYLIRIAEKSNEVVKMQAMETVPLEIEISSLLNSNRKIESRDGAYLSIRHSTYEELKDRFDHRNNNNQSDIPPIYSSIWNQNTSTMVPGYLTRQPSPWSLTQPVYFGLPFGELQPDQRQPIIPYESPENLKRQLSVLLNNATDFVLDVKYVNALCELASDSNIDLSSRLKAKQLLEKNPNVECNTKGGKNYVLTSGTVVDIDNGFALHYGNDGFAGTFFVSSVLKRGEKDQNSSNVMYKFGYATPTTHKIIPIEPGKVPDGFSDQDFFDLNPYSGAATITLYRSGQHYRFSIPAQQSIKAGQPRIRVKPSYSSIANVAFTELLPGQIVRPSKHASTENNDPKRYGTVVRVSEDHRYGLYFDKDKYAGDVFVKIDGLRYALGWTTATSSTIYDVTNGELPPGFLPSDRIEFNRIQGSGKITLHRGGATIVFLLPNYEPTMYTLPAPIVKKEYVDGTVATVIANQKATVYDERSHTFNVKTEWYYRLYDQNQKQVGMSRVTEQNGQYSYELSLPTLGDYVNGFQDLGHVLGKFDDFRLLNGKFDTRAELNLYIPASGAPSSFFPPRQFLQLVFPSVKIEEVDATKKAFLTKDQFTGVEIQRVITELKSPDARIRKLAAQALNKCKLDRIQIEDLIRSISDDDDDVGQAAAQTFLSKNISDLVAARAILVLASGTVRGRGRFIRTASQPRLNFGFQKIMIGLASTGFDDATRTSATNAFITIVPTKSDVVTKVIALLGDRNVAIADYAELTLEQVFKKKPNDVNVKLVQDIANSSFGDYAKKLLRKWGFTHN